MEAKQKIVNNLYKSLVGAGLVESQKDFANKIGMNEVSISKAMNGNEAYITKGLLKKIRNAFPQVNENWQYVGDSVNSVGDNNANGRDSKVVIGGGGKTLDKLIDEMSKQREGYESMINKLLKLLENGK